jgi:exocyst complex component 1
VLKLTQVREKRAEFVLLKCTFVRRASEFLRNYFPGLVDSMLNDKNNFSQVNLTSIANNTRKLQ